MRDVRIVSQHDSEDWEEILLPYEVVVHSRMRVSQSSHAGETIEVHLSVPQENLEGLLAAMALLPAAAISVKGYPPVGNTCLMDSGDYVAFWYNEHSVFVRLSRIIPWFRQNPAIAGQRQKYGGSPFAKGEFFFMDWAAHRAEVHTINRAIEMAAPEAAAVIGDKLLFTPHNYIELDLGGFHLYVRADVLIGYVYPPVLHHRELGRLESLFPEVPLRYQILVDSSTD